MENLSAVPDGDRIRHSNKAGLKKLLLALVIILAIGGTCASVYYYKQYRALKDNPNLEAQKETEILVSAVGKLMELPADETPTVATVADKESLKDQLFFAAAQNGDKILAYTKAMKAILYRPSINKIINVAPIVQQQEAAQNESALPAAELKIAYYNGTETAGLSGQAEKAIKAAYPNYQTAILANAAKKDYKENLVVDLTGSRGKEASDLANFLNGKVVSFPEGENRPDADILIISGK